MAKGMVRQGYEGRRAGPVRFALAVLGTLAGAFLIVNGFSIAGAPMWGTERAISGFFLFYGIVYSLAGATLLYAWGFVLTASEGEPRQRLYVLLCRSLAFAAVLLATAGAVAAIGGTIEGGSESGRGWRNVGVVALFLAAAFGWSGRAMAEEAFPTGSGRPGGAMLAGLIAGSICAIGIVLHLTGVIG